MIARRGKHIVICKSAEYQQSQSDLVNMIRQYCLLNNIELEEYHFKKNIEIKIAIWTYKDIDNCLKQILDALGLAKIIKNDRDIIRLLVIKHPVKRGTPEDILIEISGEKVLDKS